MSDVASFLGAVALLLSAVGIYGATAYSVARRSGEIAVRMAVGARRVDVVRLVLRETAAVVGAGVVLGVPAAMAAVRVASASVVGLAVGKAEGVVMAAGVLAGASLAAACSPAMRAAKSDPVTALRSER